MSLRRNVTTPALRQFLTRANISNFDVNAYLDRLSLNAEELPIIGIAISGGGYRALMNGAGAFAAFDNRTSNSTAQGHLGGILQATTYISGLSGGSWLVGSLYMQNFPTIQDVLTENSSDLGSLWQFDNSIITGNCSHWSSVIRVHTNS